MLPQSLEPRGSGFDEHPVHHGEALPGSDEAPVFQDRTEALLASLSQPGEGRDHLIAALPAPAAEPELFEAGLLFQVDERADRFPGRSGRTAGEQEKEKKWGEAHATSPRGGIRLAYSRFLKAS